MAEQRLDALADEWNPGRPTDHYNLVNLAWLQFRILQRLFAGFQRALHDRFNQRFEFRALDRAAITQSTRATISAESPAERSSFARLTALRTAWS